MRCMMAVNAAVAGIGVALGRSPMVDDALADGCLGAPFDLRLPVHDAHFVVTPEEAIGHAEAQAFKSWLIQEARAAAGGQGRAFPGSSGARRTAD